MNLVDESTRFVVAFLFLQCSGLFSTFGVDTSYLTVLGIRWHHSFQTLLFLLDIYIYTLSFSLGLRRFPLLSSF